MSNLIESTFVTLDGVISSPAEWGAPYWNDEHSSYGRPLLFGTDALLLGRKTYEGFAKAWPSRSGDDYSDRFNSMPKYVASTTLKDVAWNSTVLKGDRLFDGFDLTHLKLVKTTAFSTGIVVNVYTKK